MSDPRKTETLDLRVRFRFSRLIDPELFMILSNLNEADRSSLLHAMITRSAIGVSMPLNGAAQNLRASTAVVSPSPTSHAPERQLEDKQLQLTSQGSTEGPRDTEITGMAVACQQPPTSETSSNLMGKVRSLLLKRSDASAQRN